MRILAFITAAEPTDAILTHLGLPTTAPPLAPARGPPQHDFAFDADPASTSTRRPPTIRANPNPFRTSTSIRRRRLRRSRRRLRRSHAHLHRAAPHALRSRSPRSTFPAPAGFHQAPGAHRAIPPTITPTIRTFRLLR